MPPDLPSGRTNVWYYISPPHKKNPVCNPANVHVYMYSLIPLPACVAALRRTGGPVSANCLVGGARGREPIRNMASRDSVSPSQEKVQYYH